MEYTLHRIYEYTNYPISGMLKDNNDQTYWFLHYKENHPEFSISSSVEVSNNNINIRLDGINEQLKDENLIINKNNQKKIDLIFPKNKKDNEKEPSIDDSDSFSLSELDFSFTSDENSFEYNINNDYKIVLLEQDDIDLCYEIFKEIEISFQEKIDGGEIRIYKYDSKIPYYRFFEDKEFLIINENEIKNYYEPREIIYEKN